MTASRPPKRYPRDQRWSAAVVLTVLGAALFVVTWLLSGEGWRALAVNAGYTIGGALLTFAVLYLVSQRFESWEWIREDHDLVKRFDDELRDDA